MEPVAAHQGLKFTGMRAVPVAQVLAAEVAVALTYGGSTLAVMMASPSDLEDFALGFTLSEGVADLADIEAVVVEETPLGFDLQIALARPAEARLAARRRSRAGPVGCGLCGIESLEDAMQPAPRVATGCAPIEPDALCAALAALPGLQPFHSATRAMHVAAFWQPGAPLTLAREDVGRHNALDKLAGALARSRTAPEGVVLMSSRISVDLVQKAARAGLPVLVGASAPTAAAVGAAEAAGLTLIARARGDGFDVFAGAERIAGGCTAHVA